MNATTAYWGRESVNNPKIGNLLEEGADVLFAKIEDLYRSGKCRQLTRAYEMKHRFIIDGIFEKENAESLISGKGVADEESKNIIPCIPFSKMDFMQKPIEEKYLALIAKEYAEEPNKYRLVKHVTDVFLVYCNNTTQAVVLNQEEFKRFQDKVTALSSC
jgi:hypothetical protein